MHEVHSANGGSHVRFIGPFPNYIIEMFAVDATSDIIYFVDNRSSSIKKQEIVTGQITTLTSKVSATGSIIKLF